MTDKVRSRCGLSVIRCALAALNVRSTVRGAARSLIALVLATPGVRSDCALGAVYGASPAWASREAQPLRGWGPRPSSEEAHGADVRTTCGLGSLVNDERGRRRWAIAMSVPGGGESTPSLGASSCPSYPSSTARRRAYGVARSLPRSGGTVHPAHKGPPGILPISKIPMPRQLAASERHISGTFCHGA